MRSSEHETSVSKKGNRESGNVDVTFFELSTVLAATDNFSLNNKLGQGGFGPVYKVIFLASKKFSSFDFHFKYTTDSS